MAEEKQSLAILQKDITDTVISRLDDLKNEGLVLPKNYIPENALKSAFFKLQATKDKSDKPCLEVCTPTSIANSLLDMCTQGLNPMKTQCYFIVYGSELKMNRSYFGTQVAMKRLSNVVNIYANVIYKGDEFNYENRKGKDYLTSHTTKLENRDNEILGVYAVVEETNGDMPITVMTKKEIETAWSQSKTSQSVHKKFPQEMAKRTVINRAAKNYINTSDDSDILIESINNTTANEYEDDRIDKVGAMDVEAEVTEKANSIEFKDETVSEPVKIVKVSKKTEEKPKPVEVKEVSKQTNDAEQEGWAL